MRGWEVHFQDPLTGAVAWRMGPYLFKRTAKDIHRGVFQVLAGLEPPPGVGNARFDPPPFEIMQAVAHNRLTVVVVKAQGAF
jgi:hypothetical protein